MGRGLGPVTILKGLGGLKAAAAATVLADLHVTPELKEKLMARIGALPAPGAPAPSAPGALRRRWLATAGWSGAAAAAVTLAVLAGAPPGPAPQPAPAPAAPTQPPPSGRPVKVVDATGNQVDTLALRATVLDQNGVGLTGKAAAGTAQFSRTAADYDKAGAGASLTGAEAQPGRKVIVNGDFALRVRDARAAVAQLKALTAAAGGYVAEANLSKDGAGGWQGRLVLRVPAAKFAGTLAQLAGVGEVEGERQWTQDVTDQYMDLEHRIAIQTEHEQRLRELAAKATTFDDWIKLTAQVNETRTQIENMTGRLKLLANQVDYAILGVNVVQPGPGQVSTLSGATTLPAQAGQAFVNSGRHLAALARRAVVGAAVLAPFALALAVPVVLLVAALRRRRRPGSPAQ